MASMNPERFYEMTNTGLHYQYMHNSLQLNRGNGFLVKSLNWRVFLRQTGVGHACFLIMITMVLKMRLLPMGTNATFSIKTLPKKAQISFIKIRAIYHYLICTKLCLPLNCKTIFIATTAI